MVNNKIVKFRFDVDKYIKFTDFERIKDRNFFAAMVGCIEGNIQIDKKNSRFILLGMYNVKCGGKYLFLSIYNFIKSNEKLCNFIAKYFNLWHGSRYEEFTYDKYHKKELYANFKTLENIIYQEMKQAAQCNDIDAVQKYEYFFTDLFLSNVVTAI